MAESNRKTSQKRTMPRSHSKASPTPASSSMKSSSGRTATAEPSTSTRRKNDASSNSRSSNGVSSKISSTNCNSSAKTKTKTSSARSSEKLYALLGVPKDATSAEIGKAYRALALLLHPDKVLHRLQQQRDVQKKKESEGGNDSSRKKHLKLGKQEVISESAQTNSIEEMRQEATRHFQELQHAYSILKDPARRKLYDETGLTGEDGEEPQSFEEAYAFYRNLFPEVDVCAIEKFKENYLGSEAEKDDIREFCEKFNGNLSHFFEYIPFSEKMHVPRYAKILNELIEKKELPQAKQPTKKAIDMLELQAKKMEKLTAKEAAQLEKHKNASSSEKLWLPSPVYRSKKRKEADLDGLQALTLAIQTNANKRARDGNNFLDQLAQKYGEGQGTGSGRKSRNK